MVIGDRIETAIYGRVTISVIYESEGRVSQRRPCEGRGLALYRVEGAL